MTETDTITRLKEITARFERLADESKRNADLFILQIEADKKEIEEKRKKVLA
jgi:hypothetical protein